MQPATYRSSSSYIDRIRGILSLNPATYHDVEEDMDATGQAALTVLLAAFASGVGALISRDLIADSIELVARGNMFDGLIALSGCDKTIPGTIMALARLDIPGVMLYGGSIAPGEHLVVPVTDPEVADAIANELQRERTWQPLEARELRDVTVGIVGLGSIGRADAGAQVG